VRKLTRRLGAGVVEELTRCLIGKGAARDPVQSEGCEDRLDCRGGRRALSEGRGFEPGRSEDPGAPGAQAHRAHGRGRRMWVSFLFP
jgi:hypothetical protein